MFQSWLSSLFIIFYRFDDLKDKIRKVLKGRVPLDKDVKKEITQALRLGKSFIFFFIFFMFTHSCKHLPLEFGMGT